jgi:hypothetical protein
MLDIGYSIKVVEDDSVYICGETDSNNFPTTCGAYDRTRNNEVDDQIYSDAFVLEFDFSGLSETPPIPPSLVFSTFVGGNERDGAFSLDVDESGNIYCTGRTSYYSQSNTFPVTTGAYDETYNGGEFDCFIFKLDPDGSDLLAATFIGGSIQDYGLSLCITPDGIAVTGFTSSSNYPAIDDDTTFNGIADAFVSCLETDLSNLVYSSFIGGTSFDTSTFIKNVGSSLYVTGRTDSTNFPVTNGAYDQSYNGSNDIFVFKLSI